jgi:hypothetical protein
VEIPEDSGGAPATTPTVTNARLTHFRRNRNLHIAMALSPGCLFDESCASDD